MKLAGCVALLALTAWGFAQTKTPPKSAPKKSAKKTVKRRARVPAPPRVTPQQKAEASEAVHAKIDDASELGILNAAAMVPLYEMLHRLEQSHGASEPLRVLQFGDSHTASDDWAGELRGRFQQRFGDGGPGFTHAGRPFAGFRRYDSKATMSRGWKADGLLAREGDGIYGIGGVRMSASSAGETMTLEAEGESVEFFYLKQPGAGRITIEDNGVHLATIDTAGESGPGYWKKTLEPGMRRLTARTEDDAPVHVFGWVVEKRGGITWETLGVNGAQADLLLLQHEGLLRSHIEHRNPALVVLAYGTNEARRADWTEESYRSALQRVIALVRAAAPATSILVVGAPDQMLRTRRGALEYGPLDRIVAAQREAALASGCGFWNLRTAMGGKGSMKQWVRAGLAQGDYVHLTAAGYRMLGDALYTLITSQYGIFQSVRKQLLGSGNDGTTLKDH